MSEGSVGRISIVDPFGRFEQLRLTLVWERCEEKVVDLFFRAFGRTSSFFFLLSGFSKKCSQVLFGDRPILYSLDCLSMFFSRGDEKEADGMNVSKEV